MEWEALLRESIDALLMGETSSFLQERTLLYKVYDIVRYQRCGLMMTTLGNSLTE